MEFIKKQKNKLSIALLILVMAFAIIIYQNFLIDKFVFFEGVLGNFNNLVILFLAVLGWGLTVWLQGRNNKENLKNQIKYDIYKQLVILYKDNNESLASLMAKTSSPFIMMESSMISYNLKLKKEYKGEWICYSEAECVLDGSKKWNLFIGEISNSYFDFSEKYNDILYMLEAWEAPIKNLNVSKESLLLEINKIKERVYKNINILQMYSTKNGYDWRKWKKEDVEKILDDININLMNVNPYFHDFMVLVHNKLLSEYFGYSRPTRKTLDKKYKVLTEKGFVINLEKDQNKIEEYRKIIKENEKYSKTKK
jgi:hypothetical protein